MTVSKRMWVRRRFWWIAITVSAIALVACNGSPTNAEPSTGPTNGATVDVPTEPPATSAEPPATSAPADPSGTSSATRTRATVEADTGPEADPTETPQESTSPVASEDLPDDPRQLMMATLDGMIVPVFRKMVASGNTAYIPVLLEF